MNGPEMLTSRAVAQDTTSLTAYLPVPGFGMLPVNAYVIQAAEPVLVDTGLAAVRKDFMQQLQNTIDPESLRWIWITHADADHLGNLEAVLSVAPHARIITTFVGMAKMGLQGLPLDRTYLLNPGQSLHVGDRTLQAIAPPTFDAPETTGLLDEKTATLFSADSFGALVDRVVENAEELSEEALQEGQIGWATLDAPWLSRIDKNAFSAHLNKVRDLNASTILSSHLPPAASMTDTLLNNVLRACDAPAFVGPDQQALEAMMSAA